MDFTPKKSVFNPYYRSNPISKLFFIWLVPLFRKGAWKNLETEDMFDVLRDEKSKLLGDGLEALWLEESQKCANSGKTPSLTKMLIRMFGVEYFSMWLVMACGECVFRLLQPFALKSLILSFEKESDATRGEQYWYALSVTLSTLGTTLIWHPALFTFFRIGTKCRIACSSLIYRKALRLSKVAQGKTTVGQLINILSNDVNRFDQNLYFVPFLVLGPMQLLILSYFLWQEFGVSSLAGVGTIVGLIPLQYWNGKYSTKFRLNIALRADERGRVMNEIILAMRVIKMYAWEKPFSEVIKKIRALEVNMLKKRSHLRGLYFSLFSTASKIIPYLMFLTYVLSGNDITSDKVFFAMICYHTLIQSMIYAIPSATAGTGEILVGLERIEKFMMLEEIDSMTDEKITALFSHSGTIKTKVKIPSIDLKSLTASWTKEQPNLKNIDFHAKGNKIVAIVGHVGSGKTTLLHALLRELYLTSGECHIHGTLAYACQEPWIFAGNVQQNILFGKPYDKGLYKDVIYAAALEEDLKQLPFGDMTIVGERGVSLSGGQKARINLARALYQQADIYLLDDPLSAVDSRVSRHLFENCIKKHLDGQLRIIVTHQLQYLQQVDHIVVLQNGEILSQGTYEELVDRGIDFVSLMAADEIENIRKRSCTPVEKVVVHKITKHKKQEAEEEKMAVGEIGLKTYWEYFKIAESPVGLTILLIVLFLSQASISSTEFWLSYWTNAEEGEGEYQGENFYLLIYSGLALSVIILNLGRSVTFFNYVTQISINMHARMFSSVVRAPIRFFDHNPSGRIMNRFSKDLGTNDELLPVVFFDMLIIFSQMAGILVIVTITNYYTTVPSLIVLILLWLIRRWYIKTARDVKRIEGMTKSPMFTHTAATFQGLTTIRSTNGADELLIHQFDEIQDIHSASWFVFIATSRAFGVWIEMISIAFLAAVTFSFLVIQNSSLSGSVGLAVSSSLTLAGWFQFGMKQSAEVENFMTSVERTIEYAKLEPEASLESEPDKKPPKNWPTKGEIQFDKIFVAYENKDVLKNLSFTIHGCEKIGIVGRTGAGKSSIIQAMFRMTEPKGHIYIDGVKTDEIGLHDLRKVISIIPQDPILFSGTMRYNLDPFSQFNDDELWRVLEEVELKDAVASLDSLVTEGGGNYSLGQRQLVCLARAVLRSNKIIVMDEATANVDPRTDSLIQKTIREKFNDCTIITIAHRLNSVIDCDRILVLDNGTLKEFDSPYTLLQNSEGIFSTMVDHTGKSSSALLRKAAADAFRKSS